MFCAVTRQQWPLFQCLTIPHLGPQPMQLYQRVPGEE